MELLHYMENGKRLFQKSPIRSLIREGGGLAVEKLAEDLERVVVDADILLGKLDKPLRIVLVGEVKAGKSTLLNTLAGGEVSPVDVKEATAAIIEVYHSEREEGAILFQDGDKITGTPKER